MVGILSSREESRNAMGENNRVDIRSRNLALCIVSVFLVGTLIGSLATESGNVLSYYLNLSCESGHFFNPYFLAVGIIGVMLALFTRYKRRV